MEILHQVGSFVYTSIIVTSVITFCLILVTIILFCKYIYDLICIGIGTYKFTSFDTSKSFIRFDSSTGSSVTYLHPKNNSSIMQCYCEKIDMDKDVRTIETYLFEGKSINYHDKNLQSLIHKAAHRYEIFTNKANLIYHEDSIDIPTSYQDTIYKNNFTTFIYPKGVKASYECFMIRALMGKIIESGISDKVFLKTNNDSVNDVKRTISKLKTSKRQCEKQGPSLKVSVDEYKRLVTPELMKIYKGMGLTVYLDGKEF